MAFPIPRRPQRLVDQKLFNEVPGDPFEYNKLWPCDPGPCETDPDDTWGSIKCAHREKARPRLVGTHVRGGRWGPRSKAFRARGK